MTLRLIVRALALTVCMNALAQGQQDPVQILQKTREAYLALNSYSDTGEVLRQYGTSSEDRDTFTTYFKRMPRGFLLDFKKQGGVRFVISGGDPDAFHSMVADDRSTIRLPQSQ